MKKVQAGDRFTPKLMNYVKRRARKYYMVYRGLFEEVGLEYEDIIQECYVNILETINKYPDKEGDELKKLIHLSLNNALKDVTKKAKNNKEDTTANEILDLIPQESELHSENTILTNLSPKSKEAIKIMKLVHMLSDREKKIFLDKVFLKKTFDNLAKEHKIGITRVKSLYDNIVTKIQIALKGVENG